MSLRRETFLLEACGGLCVFLGTAAADEVCLTVGATVTGASCQTSTLADSDATMSELAPHGAV